ncbi:polysaccharide deacetylase family protein [Marinobacter sp. SS21]|uniref:polysaccharide deacetylase family protein n=1 Tax=Marinobacter sp. SS21 TaxID=2979460 RepID=UPI002330E4BC|nr:polysaccharide deacetylase family protein [Marinobacter sp. SS21]MDC0661949.1 polysaccharide deacetylase family protein [Marinobacter sp. SS21]
MSFKSVVKSSVVQLLAKKYLDDMARIFTPFLVPIFMLHRFADAKNNISGHDPEFVDGALRLLKHKGYTVLDLDEAVELVVTQPDNQFKVVCFTLDDGFDDQVNTAAEIFGNFSCVCTCFLITDFLDGVLWPWDSKLAHVINNLDSDRFSYSLFDESHTVALETPAQRRQAIRQIWETIKRPEGGDVELLAMEVIRQSGETLPAEVPSPYRPVSWQRVRELEAKGVRFGAHTRSHRILSRLDEEQSRNEIVGSHARLAQEVDRPSQVFCYPVGRSSDYSQREVATVEAAGYRAAVCAEPGYMTRALVATGSRFAIPRFGLPNNMDDLLQYCSWIEYAKGKVLARG